MTAAFDLTGQRIAITGAAGGIGSATAKLVSKMGADVLVADLEAPNALADYLASKGRESSATSLDVTDRAAVEAWAADCGIVTALIDCAAICPFDDWHDDGWDDVATRVFNINLQGPLNLTRVFMKGMIDRGRGGGSHSSALLPAVSAGSRRPRITRWQREEFTALYGGPRGAARHTTSSLTLSRRRRLQRR